MSGQLGGQVRVLPFTGLTALPFVLVGMVLTAGGAIVRKLARPRDDAAS